MNKIFYLTQSTGSINKSISAFRLSLYRKNPKRFGVLVETPKRFA